MAVDYFLKIKDIEGESEKDKKEGEIDILSWSWGASHSGTYHLTGKGAASGKASMTDVTVTKFVDSATPYLLQSCCTGNEIDEAVLTARKAAGSGEDSIDFLVLTMKPVMITSVSTGGNDGDVIPVETITLNFKEVGVDYTGQEETGGAGKTGTFKFNMATGKEVP